MRVPDTLNIVTHGLITSIGIVATSAYISPYLAIPAIVLGILAIPVRNVYMHTSRDLKRIDAVTKSPVYGHITTTFDGLTTVRALGLEHLLEKQYIEFLNDSFASTYLTQLASRTLGFS